MIAAAFIVAGYVGLMVEFGWWGALAGVVHLAALVVVRAWPR